MPHYILHYTFYIFYIMEQYNIIHPLYNTLPKVRSVLGMTTIKSINIARFDGRIFHASIASSSKQLSCDSGTILSCDNSEVWQEERQRGYEELNFSRDRFGYGPMNSTYYGHPFLFEFSVGCSVDCRSFDRISNYSQMCQDRIVFRRELHERLIWPIISDGDCVYVQFMHK